MNRVDKSFNCCGNKQGDLYITTLNFLASAFHLPRGRTKMGRRQRK